VSGPPVTGPPVSDQQRAWAWVEHLRAGGTTPWASFAGEDATGSGPWLPGAIQLEVVRRLNLAAGQDRAAQDSATVHTAAHRALVDRVLDSSAPGRGQPDLGLVGAAPESAFGPRPVDPARLPTEELVRLAVGVLAELAVERDPGPQPFVRPRRRPPWRRGYQLLGDPVRVEATRNALGGAGTRPGPRPRTAVVLGDDLGVVLADVWGSRVRQTSSAGWPAWLAAWAQRDELPPQADLAGIAARWAGRVGADNVHVVVQQHPGPEVARIVGRRRPLGATYTGLSGAALQVVRDTNVVLRVLVDAERHQRLLDHVVLPSLAHEHGPCWPLPARHVAWVRRRAERLRDDLLAGGYSLHSDPNMLVPDLAGAPALPSDVAVLDVALRALLATREGATREEDR